MKLEYFFLGDEYFVVLIFKLFGHSGRAGFGFVAGDKNILRVKSDSVTLRLFVLLMVFVLWFRPLTQRRWLVKVTVFTQQDFLEFL